MERWHGKGGEGAGLVGEIISSFLDNKVGDPSGGGKHQPEASKRGLEVELQREWRMGED